MNYKTVLGAAGIALTGAVAFSVSAQAADLGGRHHESYKDEPVYVAPTTWSGAYIGGHLGASWTSGNADVTSELFGFTSTTHKELGESSVLGGVHGGYNWQHGAFVYGVEGDVSFANHIDYLASVRGRLGVAAGNWLFYGTGGVAFIGTDGPKGTIHSSVSVDTGDGIDTLRSHYTYDASENQTGFVVGGGTEVKLSPNWSIGVEALYYGFDGVSQKSARYNPECSPNCSSTATLDAGADVGVVRGRLSYHFNRGYEPLK